MRTTTVYEIRVEGHIGDSWSSWFEGLSVCREGNGETVLRGTLVDQAALHGVLMRIRDLGLPLVSVRRVEGDSSCCQHTSRSNID
jgi:wyosine [tRNA(Phe)-imidazoG37] synthetase (radical SAM superfamily)